MYICIYIYIDMYIYVYICMCTHSSNPTMLGLLSKSVPIVGSIYPRPTPHPVECITEPRPMARGMRPRPPVARGTGALRTVAQAQRAQGAEGHAQVPGARGPEGRARARALGPVARDPRPRARGLYMP